MSIDHAILGLLSWRPLTGYDLKQVFAGSVTLPWSGNSNQIYRSLVDLHKRGLVDREVQDQEKGPTRKIYTVTDAGRSELREWLLSAPELPQLRHSFLVQLAWADKLDEAELDGLLARYEEEVHAHLKMLHHREQQQNDGLADTLRDSYINSALARTPREAYLWAMILENWIAYYERELYWVRRLRSGLSEV